MNELIDLVLHTDQAILRIVTENLFEAYVVLFLIIFCETGILVTPFLPGDGLLFTAGVIAASTSLSISIVIPLLIIAAIVGNMLNYAIGSYFGVRLERSEHPLVKKYIIKYIIQTRHFYEKWGGKSIVVGRFFPIIRTYIPFFAGLTGFEYRKFSLYTIIGSVLWVPFFTLTGYFIGDIPWVKKNFGFIFLGLVFVTLIPFFYNALKLMFRKKTATEQV